MQYLLGKKQQVIILLSFLLFFCGCASISQFDHHSYVQTTSLKVDALNLMDKSVSSFDSSRTVVVDLRTNLQKLYEYERNRPKNAITVQMWNKMLNPDGNLLGGFLKRWEAETRLRKAFVDEMKLMVGDGFDCIAGLESKKIRVSDISNK